MSPTNSYRRAFRVLPGVRLPEETGPVVHVLAQGGSLCGDITGRVVDWPPGHEWTYMKQWRAASCEACQRVAVAIERHHDKETWSL